jgi:hypothetical protein
MEPTNFILSLFIFALLCRTLFSSTLFSRVVFLSRDILVVRYFVARHFVQRYFVWRCLVTEPLQGFINKFITLEPSEINNRFFLVEFLKTWPIFSAISEIFLMFHTPTEIFQNC